MNKATKAPKKKTQTHREASFWDKEQRLDKISKLGDPLERLARGIDFEAFRPLLEGALAKEKPKGKGPGGRPAYDTVLMFQILVLQRYYHLSDDQTEFQINDRASFQRFLGLRPADRVPDSKTVWLFRETLTRAGALEKAFALFLAQLERLGLVAREGTIVDASFVEVPRQRNRREETDQIKEGKTPKSFTLNPHRLPQKDVDARWGKKGAKSFYGYKDHVKVDSRSKLITGYTVTDASVHDSQALATLLLDGRDDGKKLHADSAYVGKEQEATLAAHKMEAHVCEKGYKDHPLTLEQRQSNHKKSKTRCRVEHVFGFMENSMHGMGLACIGITRATALIALSNLTYNMFLYLQLPATRG